MDHTDEKVIEEVHPVLIGYISYLFWGAVLSVLVIGLFIFLYVYLDKKTRKYTITSRRIIVEYGILGRNKDEIDIANIRTINTSQSLLQRLFRCGDILIGTSGTAGYEILLNYIPNPRQIADKINRLKASL
ncbi:MAG: PH domain-containing protein [Candidatus Omnitrophica bacterium]|nr:PH domain-containing protein [Candidatus Omnitrophota bacterium]